MWDQSELKKRFAHSSLIEAEVFSDRKRSILIKPTIAPLETYIQIIAYIRCEVINHAEYFDQIPEAEFQTGV